MLKDESVESNYGSKHDNLDKAPAAMKPSNQHNGYLKVPFRLTTTVTKEVYKNPIKTKCFRTNS
jgi:hypothetical protein